MSTKMSVAAMLTPEQIQHLDDLARQMKQSGGVKLSRSAIVRNLVRILKCLNPDVKAITNEEELIASLLKSAVAHEGDQCLQAKKVRT